MLVKKFGLMLAFCVVAHATRSRCEEADDTSSTHYKRAIDWHVKKELDKALSEYDQAIQTDPPSSLVYCCRALAWYEKGDFDKSIADYNEAIRLDPKHVWAYSNRAGAWAAKGDFARAIADYDESIRLDPTYALAYKNRAWIWATCSDDSVRDGKRAVDSAIRGCELTDWKEATYLDALAAAYAEAGDFEAAVAAQTKAIEITRDFAARLKSYQDKKWERGALALTAHLSQLGPLAIYAQKKDPAPFFIVPYDATLYLSVAGGNAGGVTEFGLGTSEAKHTPIFTALPRDPQPKDEVKIGFVKAGSKLDFYEKTDWAGIHWAFTRDRDTKASLLAFFDPDNSLGLGGSVIEKTGPEIWILHLDDAASGLINSDNDGDILIEMRLVPTKRSDAVDPFSAERK
jgi:hypothetical protein